VDLLEVDGGVPGLFRQPQVLMLLVDRDHRFSAEQSGNPHRLPCTCDSRRSIAGGDSGLGSVAGGQGIKS
jgi:hypothetical protein